MLRRGWMDRYLPAVAHENLSPHIIVASGYAWAILMFCLGIANLVVAADCSRQNWVLFVTLVPLTAKFAAFGLQYAVFRSLIVRRLRSTRPAAVPAWRTAGPESRSFGGGRPRWRFSFVALLFMV